MYLRLVWIGGSEQAEILLFCGVDLANEGVHMEGSGGVVTLEEGLDCSSVGAAFVER